MNVEVSEFLQEERLKWASRGEIRGKIGMAIELRFGQTVPSELQPVIAKQTDTAVLARWLDLVLAANSPEVVRQAILAR